MQILSRVFGGVCVLGALALLLSGHGLVAIGALVVGLGAWFFVRPVAPDVPGELAEPPPQASPIPLAFAPPPAIVVVSDESRTVAASIHDFAVDLYRALADRPGDLFVSPASLSIAFAMVHAGARGETREELARTLHFAGSDELRHRGFAELLRKWSIVRPGCELAVASGLFGERTVRFVPEFLAVTQAVFAAPLATVDFRTDAEPARARINGWVAGRTRDRITDLVPAGGVDGTTRLVLVNAVYFKAAWQVEFDPRATRPGVFHGADGARTVPMMSQTGHFALTDAPLAGLRALELPYADGRHAMTIVLPDARDGLAAVERALTPDALRRWLAPAQERQVRVRLPRFEIDPPEALCLSDVLARLGLVTAFADTADFTGMAAASEQLQLSEAYHTAFIAVDEQGTEAAAATALSMCFGSLGPPAPPVEFFVEHPFLFVIRDTRSGAVLFIGRITDFRT